jgi:hypothetical protein
MNRFAFPPPARMPDRPRRFDAARRDATRRRETAMRDMR